MPKQRRSIISLSEIPFATATVICIVTLGSLLGLLSYNVVELNKTIFPAEEKHIPSMTIAPADYFGNDFIKVKYPKKNSAIGNPVSILGKANVYEGTVRIRIKEENENILYDGFLTAEGAYDKLYPFQGKIAYDSPSFKKGIIEFFEESSKDGRELHKVVIPVTFTE